MAIRSKCPICSKILELENSWPMDDSSQLDFYRCGHFFIANHSIVKLPEFATTALKGSFEAFPYQVEGVQFIRESGFNCLIGDQMGLGKTIQAVLAVRSEPVEKMPALVLVRKATLWQWVREIQTWGSDDPTFATFAVLNGKGFIPKGFKFYVVSMDTFSRDWKRFTQLGIKTLIIDECHSFKNPESNRSQSLVDFIKFYRMQSSDVKYTGQGSWTASGIGNDTNALGTIFLSGTPIKNRADEFFIPLNLMRPDIFPSLDRFRRQWLTQSANGKWERISPYAIDRFREKIAPFVLRRERLEVLTDLPSFQRNFIPIEMADTAMNKAYNIELENLRKKADSLGKDELTWTDVSDHLMTLRKIVGCAKTEWCKEFVEDFLDSTTNEKLAIGIHHHVVRDTLRSDLRNFHPVELLSGATADRAIEEWNKEHRQICIISELAGGTGLNLQFCNNVLILERQWNAADEEQFEDRFNRIGQKLPVTATYPVAKGTIDEYFHNMVANKRAIFGETVGNNWSFTSDNSSVTELVNWAVHNRLAA